MTQEDVVEARMLELERAFRRRLRADEGLRRQLPRAAQLVYLVPDDPAFNAETLQRAAAATDGADTPAVRYVVMSDPPELHAQPPAHLLHPRAMAPSPARATPAPGPPGQTGETPNAIDWPLVAGIVVTGELRACAALWQLRRTGERSAALADFEHARDAELTSLSAAGVAAPHALVGAVRLGLALALAIMARRRR